MGMVHVVFVSFQNSYKDKESGFGRFPPTLKIANLIRLLPNYYYFVQLGPQSLVVP